jgi:hypothetical protein
MPPGNYHFAGDNDLTASLYNMTISGYGATVPGYPPDFQFLEYKQIVNISESIVHLPLQV